MKPCTRKRRIDRKCALSIDKGKYGILVCFTDLDFMAKCIGYHTGGEVQGPLIGPLLIFVLSKALFS
jgi:hypothetical protein